MGADNTDGAQTDNAAGGKMKMDVEDRRPKTDDEDL